MMHRGIEVCVVTDVDRSTELGGIKRTQAAINLRADTAGICRIEERDEQGERLDNLSIPAGWIGGKVEGVAIGAKS